MPSTKLRSLFKRNKQKPSSINLPNFTANSETYDIVIHIGAPKTGSSAIQKFLLNNTQKLKLAGFYYPKHDLDENGISGGHSNIATNLIQGNLSKASDILSTYLIEAKKKNLTLLISAESLFFNPKKLKQITGNHNCKIISFFRDPLESIFSNYNQLVKRHFEISTLEQFCENIINKDVPFLSGITFDKWEQYFKKDNLIVLGYDPVVLNKSSIQELFLLSLGISQEITQEIKPKKAEIINRSYSSTVLELKRMLNFVLDKNQNEYNNQIDLLLQRSSDQPINLILDNKQLTSIDLLDKLQKKFEPSNLLIKQKYIINLNDQFLISNSVTNKTKPPYTDTLVTMIQLLNQIKTLSPHLYQYIKTCTQKYLKEFNPPYSVVKLAEWLDIQVPTNISQDIWFNPNQLMQIGKGNYQEPDYLRDIAQLLLIRKDYKNANQLINRARKLRPNGPGIIKLQKK